MSQTLLFCDLDLQFQGHCWPLKGQIFAISSHFAPVLIYRKLDHPMAGVYNTYIYVFCKHEIWPWSSSLMVIRRPPKYLTEAIFGLFGDIFTLIEKNIIATLLNFTGYIHSHKILPGNIFGPILKNKMAAMGIFSTFSKDFCWPSRAKGITGRDIKIAGCFLVQNLDSEYFWPHFEKQDGRHGRFFVSHEKCLCLPYYWS